MKTRLRILVPFAAALLLVVSGVPLAVANAHGHHRADGCPHCAHKICQPIAEKTKETKDVWRVERKEICIPHITWPWQRCCGPAKCGRVKTVHVLKKESQTCERCGYRWEIKNACTGCAPDAPPRDE